jgi:hypothetical protein
MVIRRLFVGLLVPAFALCMTLQAMHIYKPSASAEVRFKKEDFKNISQDDVRCFLHDSLQRKDVSDSNLRFLSNKCFLEDAQDLIVEASMVDRLDIVKFLINRVEKLEKGRLSEFTYRAMVMGYHAACFPEEYEKLPENPTAAFFRSMFKEAKFAKAIEDYK